MAMMDLFFKKTYFELQLFQPEDTLTEQSKASALKKHYRLALD